MLHEIKKEKITAKVLECDRNSKKLYDLVSNLTGTKVVTHPIFNPHGPAKASFDSFKPVSIDDIV